MPIDPKEKFVYLGKGPRPWWTTGEAVPVDTPRDLRWYLEDDDGRSCLVLTLDLRTLKLYARFRELDADTEARMLRLDR